MAIIVSSATSSSLQIVYVNVHGKGPASSVKTPWYPLVLRGRGILGHTIDRCITVGPALFAVIRNVFCNYCIPTEIERFSRLKGVASKTSAWVAWWLAQSRTLHHPQSLFAATEEPIVQYWAQHEFAHTHARALVYMQYHFHLYVLNTSQPLHLMAWFSNGFTIILLSTHSEIGQVYIPKDPFLLACLIIKVQKIKHWNPTKKNNFS